MSIRAVVFGVVLGIVVMGGLGLLLDRLGIIELSPEPPEPPREYNAIAVLPLTEAEGDAGALANSVCDQLAIQLTQKGLPVIPWFRTRRISSTRDLKEIGAELSADVLIHGSLVVEDGRARGVVRLRNLAERGSDFRVELNAPVGDPLITARFIARKISYELRPLEAPDLPEQTREDALELARRGNELIRLETEEATLKAKDLFEQALAIDPGLAEAYVGMGTFYYRSSSSPQALAMYELALELDPGSVPARRGMVMIYWAVAEFEKGLALAGSSPGDMDPRERLTLVGEAYVKCGLPRRAVPILEAARVLAPEDDGVLWNLVMAYNWSGRYREAVDCSLEFFRRFGDNGWLNMFTGQAYFGLGVPDSALYSYGKNIAEAEGWVGPSHMAVIEIHDLLGNARLAREKRIEFVNTVTEQLLSDPGYIYGRLMRAECYLKLGDLERFEAEKVALRTIVGERGNWSWMFAFTLAQAGEAEEAMEWIRHGLSLGVLFYQVSIRDDGKGQFFWAAKSLTSHPKWPALREEIRAKEDEMWEKYGIE